MARRRHSAAYYRHRSVVRDLAAIVDMARASAARSVNGVMNAAHWLIGRQLVAYEHSITWPGHKARLAERKRLSENLKRRLGSGFGTASLSQMEDFYEAVAVPTKSSGRLPRIAFVERSGVFRVQKKNQGPGWS